VRASGGAPTYWLTGNDWLTGNERTVTVDHESGDLLGTFLGLIIIGVITNSFVLTNVPIYWQMVVRGIILILAVSIDSIRRGGGYR